MDNIDLSQWYTAKEAAARLGTTTKYVRTLGVQYKRFKTHKLHEHMMLYWKADVDAYQSVKPGKVGRRTKNETKS